MTNHKGNKSIPAYTAPTSWEEVTVKQFYRLRELSRLGGSALFQLVHQMQTLTGVPAETWANADAEEVNKHLGQFGFILTGHDWEGLPVPKSLEIDGIKVAVPDTLRGQAFGKTISLEAIVDAVLPRDEEEKPDPEEMVSTFPRLVAVLLEDVYRRGAFDEDKALAFVEKIENLAAVEVLPVGFFLFRRLRETLLRGRKSLATSLAAKR